MNSTQQSTQYTAMYNTFKTYIHGKDIDTSYPLDLNKEKEKNKTNPEFYANESNKFDEKYAKSENNFAQDYLINSYDSGNNNNNIQKYELIRNGPMQKITEVDRESEETFQNEEPKFYDEYDEQYVNYIFKLFLFQRNIICWNCKTAFVGGKTWEKVTCPKCKEINEVDLDENEKVSEWERFLEMKHIKVTCPNCKKNIYCTRESEFVTCNECHCVMTIIKDVPLRPGTYEHKFTASIAVKNKEEDNKNILANKNDVKKKGIGIYKKNDPFQELLDVSKKNENNIKKIINK